MYSRVQGDESYKARPLSLHVVANIERIQKDILFCVVTTMRKIYKNSRKLSKFTII